MTKARSELVSIAQTPFYHCISRCVRRAFLCGQDAVTGKDLSHRREWVVQRMRLLAKVFTIDVCAFAIMGNHYHLVLRIDCDKAQRLSTREVATRWRRLFGADAVLQGFLSGATLGASEQQRVNAMVAKWRCRLSSLSWYMRALNEYIARRANTEDGCRGRFWEGRFKSQALLDDQALLSCMVYVDLNPIRAGMARTPEASAFTSISQRIRGRRAHLKAPMVAPRPAKAIGFQTACPLMPFARQGKHINEIPFDSDEYLALVDWSGRIVRPDKYGAIPCDLPPILHRLGIRISAFSRHVARGAWSFGRAIGTVDQLRAFSRRSGQRFVKGVGAASALFGDPRIQPTNV